MCRAGSLAGRCAAGHNIAASGAVADIVALGVPGNFLIGMISVGDLGINRAALLTELESVGLAVFDALAAGDALVLVDSCDEVGLYCLCRAEHICDTQSVAGAAAAVADSGGIFKAGGLVYLVDKAVVLCTLEYLVSLLLGDEAVSAETGVVECIVV